MIRRVIALGLVSGLMAACSDSDPGAGLVTPTPELDLIALPFEEIPPLPALDLDDPYDLPDALLMEDGTPVEDARRWWFERRPELLTLFSEQVYGTTPNTLPVIEFELLESSDSALGGIAVRKQVRAHLGDTGVFMDMLVYLPAAAAGPSPVFANLNFMGNHTVSDEPEIVVPQGWVPNSDVTGVTDNIALESSRGARSSRYPMRDIIARGYGLITAYSGDLDPDFDDGFQNGIHPLFYQDGQSAPAADEWGAIGAWAWGMSRMIDYAESDDDIDALQVMAIGHSRLGKTALWAAAQDPRFALAVSNNSGAVGAALSRPARGETVAFINLLFPHWFADNFVQYADNESLLPVDQHQLIALIAPRPVAIGSAVEDPWADPLGEYESALYASDVYRLLGRQGISALEQSPVNQPVTSILGYHLRTGGHDLTAYDWEQYMNFADIHLLD